MIKLRSREEQKINRLNLVPIMDAVFIFIFFLLFSAQFIKIYEIETHAPIVSTVPSDKKMDKEPLNLTLKISQERIEVFTGIKPALRLSVDLADNNALEQLKSKMIELRSNYPEDDEAIISALPTTKYDIIVKTIDAIQHIPAGQTVKIKSKGIEKKLTKIYTQVVLEPLNL